MSDPPPSCGTEMLPGDHVPVDRTAEGQRDHTQGDTSLISAEEIPSTRDHVTRENIIPSDLITSQPLPAAAPPLEPSAGVGELKKPQGDIQKLCPHCGRSPSPRVPDHRLSPLSPALSRLQGSSLSVQSNSSSKKSKSRDSLASSHKPTATQDGSCLRLVLACLSCQCSVLLLGLLEACSSCIHALCSSCCHGCDRCCAALQEAPVEELNCHAHCHSVLLESCCEPTECLGFCLECCEICHHS